MFDHQAPASAGKGQTCFNRSLQFAYRVVSITRLPASKGRGVLNEADLFHEQGNICVTWHSSKVDIRLKRGCYVTVRGIDTKTMDRMVWSVNRLEVLDKPLPQINPFDSVPLTWVQDRQWVQRASVLWGQLSRPFQHLVTAVLWDGARFERFLTGPTSLAAYRPYPNGNLRHAVETAEMALRLAQAMPDVCLPVLVAAAFLHDLGKADEFHLLPAHEGFVLSERGALVGSRHTILEWLAIARWRDGVIVPETQYLSLIHALTAARGVAWLGVREPQTIEATIFAVADRTAAWGAMGGGCYDPSLFGVTTATAMQYCRTN